MSTDVAARLAQLAALHELPARAERQLAVLLDLVAAEPTAITSVRDPAEGVDAHVADSLVALAPLTVVVEYAAPLLEAGGLLVAWKGHRNTAEEADGAAAAETLGMSTPEPTAVEPFPGARGRHLYLSSKVSPTPPRYPRRPG